MKKFHDILAAVHAVAEAGHNLLHDIEEAQAAAKQVETGAKDMHAALTMLFEVLK